MSVPTSTSAPAVKPTSLKTDPNRTTVIDEDLMKLGGLAVRLGSNPSDEQIAEFNAYQVRIRNAHSTIIDQLTNQMMSQRVKAEAIATKLQNDLNASRSTSLKFQRLHRDDNDQIKLQVEEINRLRNPSRDLKKKIQWCNVLKMDFNNPEIAFNKNDPYHPARFLLGIRKLFNLLLHNKATIEDNTVLGKLIESVDLANKHEITSELNKLKEEYEEKVQKVENQLDKMLGQLQRAENQASFCQAEMANKENELKRQLYDLCVRLAELTRQNEEAVKKIEEKDDIIKRLEKEKNEEIAKIQKETDAAIEKMQKEKEEAEAEAEKRCLLLEAEIGRIKLENTHFDD